MPTSLRCHSVSPGRVSAQRINDSRDETPTIDDVRRGSLVTATGTRTNNCTMGNPSLAADVFGDWREEMLVRRLPTPWIGSSVASRTRSDRTGSVRRRPSWVTKPL